MDTIFALATAHGKAGVAVIRVSGPLALDCGARLASKSLPTRGMRMAQLKDGAGRSLMMLWFCRLLHPIALLAKMLLNFNYMEVPRLLVQCSKSWAAKMVCASQNQGVHPPCAGKREAGPRTGRRACRSD